MILTKEKMERQALFYYPQNFNVNNWMEVSAAFDELEHKQIDTPRDLLSLLYQSNELINLVNEAYGELYMKTLTNTNDAEAQVQLQTLVQNIVLPTNKRNEAILRKYYEHPLRLQLNQENYHQINQLFEDIEMQSLYGENDMSLEISQLVQDYRHHYNQIRVQHEGQSYPVNIINHILSRSLPEERESIWRARAMCCKQIKPKFESILDDLIKARHKIAIQAGFKNFYEYSLSSSFYGKMSVNQMQDIHTSIGKVILPMVRLFIKQRQKRLTLKSIRPWDLEADQEAAMLKPFMTTYELVDKAITILYDIRFEYGIILNKMYNTGLLDLDYRPEKAKGEFYSTLPTMNSGRILMNCTGHQRDVVMLFHEMGHIIQSSILSRNPLSQYYNLPVQARELASQSLVYLSTSGWDAFYEDKNDLKTAFRSLFEQDMMQLLYWTVMNKFELVIYAHPDWTPKQREKAMLDLWQQYDWGIDWTGLEEWQSILWMQELALFEFPHYSFFSALSIFNIWQIFKNYRHDALDTISRFQHFMEKTTDFTTDEMFKELNIVQDYSESHMRKMMDFVLSEYKRMGN